MKKFILILILIFCPMSFASENYEEGYLGLLIYKEPFNNKTLIINSFPTSPGAIIPIGSEIIKIDDKRIYFLPTKKIVNKLKGEMGTSVKITVKDNYGCEKEYILKRVPYTELKFDEKFDYYWGMIAPEKFFHPPNLDSLNLIKSKLCILDKTISKDDFYWAEKKQKFIREYNYCNQLQSSEQKECLNWIIEQNSEKTILSENADTEQNTNSDTAKIDNTDNSGWLAGLYLLQTASNTMNTINNNAMQHTNFYNNISNQKNIYRLNNSLNQQNIE